MASTLGYIELCLSYDHEVQILPLSIVLPTVIRSVCPQLSFQAHPIIPSLIQQRISVSSYLLPRLIS